MTQARPRSFLTRRFREYYREVVRLKRLIAEGDWVFGEEEEATAEGAELRTANVAWQRLLTLLERQALMALRAGGDFAEGMYRQGQYLMAALADEIFLNLDWRGSSAWSSNLLESKLFNSHHAGEEVFRRLDEMLFHRDPVAIDLAEIYLQALALGFQGKFRGDEEGPLKIAAYKLKLLEFIGDRDADLLGESAYLFPEAYAATLDQGSGRRLPYLRPWFLALAAVVLVWLLAAQFLWGGLTDELEPLLEAIVGGGAR